MSGRAWLRGLRGVFWGLLFAALAKGCGGAGLPTTPATFPYEATPRAQASPTVRPTPHPPATVTTPRPPGVLGSFYERRLLSVEWPRQLREGDSDWVRLRLEVDQRGVITPTVTVGDHDITGQPVYIPDLYETHNIYLQARLAAVGLHLDPSGEVQEALAPGQTVDIYWTLRGDEPGTYQAVLTARLHLVPKDPAQEERQLLLTHQLFQMQVVNFLGLSGFWVRLGGFFSALIGMLLQLPDLLALWERLKGRDDTPPAAPADTGPAQPT